MKIFTIVSANPKYPTAVRLKKYMISNLSVYLNNPNEIDDNERGNPILNILKKALKLKFSLKKLPSTLYEYKITIVVDKNGMIKTEYIVK